MQDLLITILVFTIYLILQAIFINGVYISAQGRTEILPDGTNADSEMILYPVYKFLNQHTMRVVLFTAGRILQLRGNASIPGGVLKIDEKKLEENEFGYLIFDNSFPDIKEIGNWANAYLGAKIFYDGDKKTFRFYKEEPVYKFSKYLRKPIITCVICMASFWSIFTFLIPALLWFGVDLKIVAIWIANVFCLSYLNYLIFKPRK